MEKTQKKELIAGILITTCSELANIVSNSSLGAAAYDSRLLSGNYGREMFFNGATQAGAFAGLSVATYGATKVALKALPFVSEKTAKAAGLTSAISVAYRLAKTEVFYNAVCNMELYNRQAADTLESLAIIGINTGLVAAGTLLTWDLLKLAGSGMKKVFSKKKPIHFE